MLNSFKFLLVRNSSCLFEIDVRKRLDGNKSWERQLMPKRKHASSPRLASGRKVVKLSPYVPPVTDRNMSHQVKLLPSPVKSASDKKNYRVIQLENGLKALLISDESYSLEKLDEEDRNVAEEEMMIDEDEDGEEEGEEEEEEDDDEEGESDDEEEFEDEEGRSGKKVLKSTGLKMSAAGLCVHMGSFSDPEDLPGLAHFLEHMVFMGSDKFPGENEFESFIAKHGGYDNAHTDCETTVFWFESPRRHFHEGLDRFAQFFIAPLMKQDAMQREREAVDSEYEMALPSDDNRICQIFGGLSKPGHPMGKFMWGNVSSLRPEGVTEASLHSRLHQFWSRHYTAGSLYLAVQSQHSLDTIQDWVLDCFSKVPNNGHDREEFSGMKEPFSTAAFHQLYHVLPVQNVYKLDMTWALPPLGEKYREKPLHYLGWIIGHEGKGSLLSFLKRKVWALRLTAGNAGDGFELNSTYSMFPVVLTLTKEGFENVEKVVQAVLAYIDMLKEEGPNERIFNEIKKIEDLDFAFQEESQPSENVESLCENMPFFPPERYLDGDDLLFDYDPDLLRKCTEALDREKVNIFVRAKENEATQKLDKTEPWFGTRYSQSDIPSSWLEKTSEFRDEFHLPEPNLFIAEDTSLCPTDPVTNPKYPQKIISDDLGELFFKADTIFKQPRAYIAYLLRSPLHLESLTNSVLLDLTINCLSMNMKEDVYPADLAQLSYSVYAHESGIVIKVSGLSDKLPRLLEVIIDHLVELKNRTSESIFQALVEDTKRNYHNYSIKASKLVRDVRLEVLQNIYFPAHQKHNLINSLTLDQLKDFSEKFLSSLFLQGLVQGNLTEQAARSVDSMMRSRLGCSPLAPDTVTDVRCVELPAGVNTVRCDSLANSSDANTLVTNYYQGGPGTVRDQAVLDTLVLMMEEPVFDTLRTQEQLGYSVSMTNRNTFGVLGISVTVNTQATKFTPDHVDQRIEAFFKSFISEQLTEKNVAQAVQSLIKLKLAADITLDEEMNRNWQEILGKEYVFDRHEVLASILSSISLSDVKKMLVPLISGKKLSTQIVGSSAPDDASGGESDEKETVLNYHEGEQLQAKPNEWKQTLKVHPVIFIQK